MAQLQHLRTSLTEVDSKTALSLLSTIRANRRTVREQRAIAFSMKEEAKKTKVKKQKGLDISSMSEETIEELIGLLSKMLEEGEING